MAKDKLGYEPAPREKVGVDVKVADSDPMQEQGSGSPTADRPSVTDQGEQVDIVEGVEGNVTQQNLDLQAIKDMPTPDEIDFSEVDEYAGMANNTLQFLKRVNPFSANEGKAPIKKYIDTVKKADKGTILQQHRDVKEGKPRELSKTERLIAPEMFTTLTEKNKYVMYDKDSKPNWRPRNDLAKGNIFNLKDIEDGDDIDAAIQAMAERLQSPITGSRRGEDGVMHDEAVRQLANELVLDPERMREVLTRPDGSAAVTEEIYAMSMLYTQHATKLSNLHLKAIKEGATEKELDDWTDAFITQSLLLQKFMAYRAESGRSTRTFGMVGSEMDVSLTDQDFVNLALNGYDKQTIAKMVPVGDTSQAASQNFYGVKALATLQRTSIEWFTKSILSGFKTQAINAIGVSSEMGISIVDRYIAEQGTKAWIRLGGTYREGMIAQGETAALVQGEIASVSMGLKGAIKIATTPMSKEPQQYDGGKFLESETMFKSDIPAFNAVLRLADTANGGFMTSRVMGGVDAMGKIISEQGEYVALAHRKAYGDVQRLADEGLDPDKANHFYQRQLEHYLNYPTPDMVAQARHFGKRITYQDKTQVGQGAKEMIRSVPILSFFAPFINTPISSFVKNFLERIPVAGQITGAMGAHINYGRPMNATERQMAYARQTTGGAIIATMYGLADSGVLEGSRPDWKTDVGRDEYDVWMAQKRMEMSITNDEEWQLQIKRIEQIAYIAQVVADLKTLSELKDYQAIEEQLDASEQMAELAGSITTSLLQNMEDKTFLQGLSIFFEGLDKGFGRSMMNIGEGMLPASGLRRNMTDNFFIDTTKQKFSFKEKATANLLWLRANLPDKRDMFGRVMKKDWFISPIQSGKGDRGIQPTDDDLTRKQKKILDYLYNMGKTIHKVPFGTPNKTFGDVKLTADEYTKFTKFSRMDAVDRKGRTFTEFIHELIINPRFQTTAIESRVGDYTGMNTGEKSQFNVLKKAVGSWDRGVILTMVGAPKRDPFTLSDGSLVEQLPELASRLDKASAVKAQKGRGIDLMQGEE